jgi:malonyl-CoA/methylmalonyl-CoA synthetase
MREKTAQEFRDDGFFITGDLGTLDKDERLTLVGRSRDLIISGGLNIYPKEIESVIDEPASEASIIEATALQLAPFKQPRRVILADELPSNTMGKVQKNILRDRYAG